jgi:imidazolonepropionase-like amidohydrolase
MVIMSISIIKDEKTLINPENILDPESGRMMTGKSILIKKGRISGLIDKKRYRDRNNEIDIKSNNIINLPGLTLLPGLIDSHIHFALDGVSFKDSLNRWNEPDVMKGKIKKELRTYLEFGIIAVRDGGDKAGIGLEAQSFSKDNNFLSPIVHAPGSVLRKEGLYGSFLGEGITDFSKIKEKIRELADMGVAHIKVLESGIVSFKDYGKVGSVQFTLSEMEQIVETAHDLGLKVMAHASSDEAVKISTLAGVDSIEHGYFLSEDTMQLMAERKTYWVPTVVPMYKQTIMPWKENFSNEEIAVIERTYNLHLRNIKRGTDIGVNLAIGTDSGANAVFHGDSLYYEMELYLRAGLSRLQILKAATIQGARLMGLDNKIGSVKVGKLPYFIAVEENPLNDLTCLRKPAEIILLDSLNRNVESIK